MEFTNEQKYKAAQREMLMRMKVYPNWVASGKMSSDKASYEIEVMEAIMADYQSFVEADALPLFGGFEQSQSPRRPME